MLGAISATAQNMAINTTGAAPNASTALDISSTDKGILIPRVVLVSNTDPISTAKPEGLLVYNNGGSFGSSGFYSWNGSTWVRLGLPSGTTGQTLRHDGDKWIASSKIYNNGNNVGISTTIPRAALNVYDGGESITQTNFTQSVSNAGLLITSEYSNGAYTPGVFWSTSNNNPTLPKASIHLQLAPDDSKLIFGTSTHYPAGLTSPEALVINKNGNIGVGIKEPEAQLYTTGSITFGALAGSGNQLIKVNNSGQVSAVGLGASTDMVLGDGSNATITSKAILNQNSTTQTANFRINGNGVFDGGKMGIGTTSPTYNLQVAGDAGFDEYLYHNDDANTYIQLQNDDIRMYAGSTQFIKLSEGSSDVLIINEDGNNQDLRVEGDSDEYLMFTNGNSDRLGIGTSNPMVKLHVDGSMYTPNEVTVGATTLPPADFSMMIRSSAGTDGLIIKSGGNAGDIGLRVIDQDLSFNVLDIETGNGCFVAGESYSTTMSWRGQVFGVDNQNGPGYDGDFNTQNGTYRMGGEEINPYNIGGGVVYDQVSSTSSTSTSSSSYSQISSMTTTPPAGTYMISFSGLGSGTNDDQQMQVAIYVDGSPQSYSERDYGYDSNSTNNSGRFSMHSEAVATVDGTESIEVRYKTNSGTFNVTNRSLILLKVSDMP